MSICELLNLRQLVDVLHTASRVPRPDEDKLSIGECGTGVVNLIARRGPMLQCAECLESQQRTFYIAERYFRACANAGLVPSEKLDCASNASK
jgi:hypothetical protein